jgi:error-prone DNA polymerase
VDVTISGWESALEELDAHAQRPMGTRAAGGAPRPAHAARDEQEAAERIELARAIRPFPTWPTWRGAPPGPRRPAGAGRRQCAEALAGHRRQALWQAVGAVPDKDLLRPATLEEDAPCWPRPAKAQEIVGDYRAQGLTLGRHPLALLRRSYWRSASCRPRC